MARMDRPRGRGFTLIEMMVTVIVLAVLLAIAMPNFRDMVRRSDVRSASDALLADVSYARGEAITRGATVSICPSSDGSSCTDGATAYESGWLVYTYKPGHGVAATAYDADDADTVLLRYTGARNNVSMQAAGADIVSFGTQGQTRPDGTTYGFATCSRTKGTSDHGSSTAAVAGTSLRIATTGSAVSSALAAGASCSP